MGRTFFSVLTPVYEPPIDALRAAIASVREQTFGDWELILVDDCSPSPEVLEVLQAAASDPRITVIERNSNGGIVAASNDAIAAATGEFLVLLDNDDLLHPRALEKVAAALAVDPSIDYVYTDEDKINAEGQHYDAFRKPAWSPERLRGQMYTSHLSVLRASLVREVGGFHTGFDGSQDHDLVLRVTERARRVAHVPEVLYHWRVVPGSTAGDASAKPYAWEAGRRAVQAHLDRVGVPGEVQFGEIQGTLRVKREASADHVVSVVIPTRGSSGIVWGEERVFVLHRERPDSDPSECVVLSQRDVRELQFAKAAISTGWTLLMEELGLEHGDLQQVLLAGSFGSYLSAASAVRIGLVPKLPILRIVAAGNVAGEGAKMALLSIRERHGALALLEEVTYVELSDRADFNDRFVDLLAFPG